MFSDYKATAIHWLQATAGNSLAALHVGPSGHVSSTVAEQHDHSPFNAAFDALVEQTLLHYNVSGLAIAILNGSSTFARGYGMASAKQPVTPETLFLTGSTTKAFTAAAVSLLVDDNENHPDVQWTTPMCELIGDDFVLADDYLTRHVTLQDALSHRTGMPGHEMSYGQEGSTTRYIVRSLRYLPITKPLRTSFQYCNIMVAAVGYVIEKLSAQSLAAFFNEHIWEPLNMTSTYLTLDTALRSEKAIATGYRWSESKNDFCEVKYPNETAGEGAGAMVSNVLDYAKWTRMMMTRSLPLSPAAHKALLTPQMIMETNIYGIFGTALYGQGWMLQTYKGVDVVFHGGKVYGFGAMVFYIPSRNWGTVMFANTHLSSSMAIDVLVWSLVDDLLEVPITQRNDHNALHEQELAQMREMQNPTLAREIFYPSSRRGDLPTSLPLEKYSGTYYHPAYKELSVEYSNQTLGGTITRSSLTLELKMQPVTGNFFFCIGHVVGDPDTPFYTPAEFRIDATGQATELGILLEPAMAPEKIWFMRKTSSA
ncbi:hypothetical protein MMC13_008332 [Lambiella insularis]|nr:hypothetical protein [Lambiella insularis]